MRTARCNIFKTALSPHSVWFSQYTTIVSIHSIHRLVFLMKEYCVLCEIWNLELCWFTKCSFTLAVPWLRRLVAGLSPQWAGFGSRSVRVRFVVDREAMRRGFPPSVSFYQYSVLIFIYTLLLAEEETGENWEISKQQLCFGNMGTIG